ncbi:hypothetical protein HK097_008528 [Rhizophlyctis rosea]|uniref:Glycosyltransferase family 28 N-terminal domain-containing protein n=1 Tax=Rhizophlyctis rosea TaxID=64517 RepID=A0AAD5SA74_9FUNG|nr:hypothetical protein HK097_008528 [Rhizophlyctis rosea]
MSDAELVDINSGTTSARSIGDIAAAAQVQDDGRLTLEGTVLPPAYQEHAEDEVPISSQSYHDLFQNVPAQLQPAGQDQIPQYPPPTVITPILDVPRLNIVIHIVGSRGDVQPFLALAKELQTYKHRVRIATHETFRAWVRKNNVEFYPIGGDPAELMAFMVENKGLIPTYASIAKGDVGKKRKMIKEICDGAWKSCIAPDEETGKPFRADVIMANPPSFGHIHCAEKLSIPLHMAFTMPWVPTISFPHPLTNIDHSKEVRKLLNKMSYTVVERLTWMGVGDVVNNFRERVLHLRPYTIQQATNAVLDLKVPWTFCWSPSLIPKPVDWGPEIDISGFYFLDQATNYTPPENLQAFLSAGAPPIYIGFGSITGHDPVKFTATILEGVKQANVRAIISKGWMNMGGGGGETSDPWIDKNVFFIGDCPHDWLFKNVDAVCHHGGAGTLSAGLRCGKPTIVVPFFGDQFFWGAMVYRMKAGPLPIPAVNLTGPKLAEAITTALSPETRTIASRIAEQMAAENGVKNGVVSFHAALPLESLKSDINPTHAASLTVPKLHLNVSLNVAQVLASAGLLAEEDFRKKRTKKWYIPSDHDGIPGTAAVRTALENVKNMVTIPVTKARRSKKMGGGIIDQLVFGLVGLIIASVYMCWWPFEATYYTLNELADGCSRLPCLYDKYTKPPPLPIITGLGSGLWEGWKALWVGIYDGIHDLFTRPFLYGKKDHFLIGCTWGVLVGVLNLHFKMVGGALKLGGYWLKGGTRQVLKKRHDKRVRVGGLGVEVPFRKKRWWQFWRKVTGEVGPEWVDKASSVSGYERAECERIVEMFREIVERRKRDVWWRRLVKMVGYLW